MELQHGAGTRYCSRHVASSAGQSRDGLDSHWWNRSAGPTAKQMVRYLQHNGVAAEPLTIELNGRNTGEAILAMADSLGCDLLIKGAYTQSRLRQMLFGGATQHVLANAALPVLMAH